MKYLCDIFSELVSVSVATQLNIIYIFFCNFNWDIKKRKKICLEGFYMWERRSHATDCNLLLSMESEKSFLLTIFVLIIEKRQQEEKRGVVVSDGFFGIRKYYYFYLRNEIFLWRTSSSKLCCVVSRIYFFTSSLLSSIYIKRRRHLSIQQQLSISLSRAQSTFTFHSSFIEYNVHL